MIGAVARGSHGRFGRRAKSLALAGAALAAVPSISHAQIATIDKGHQYLVTNGMYLSGWHSDASYGLNYTNLTGLNLNSVLWGVGQSNAGTALMANGQKWGKVADYTGTPSTALNGDTHTADIVGVQVGDEQQTDIESPSSLTTAWFQAAHSGGYFTNQLMFVNSNYIASDTNYANFIANAGPDAISFDAYPFSNPPGILIWPVNWLGKAQQFRRQALGSYIQATNNAPRPYGMYTQTYHGGDGARDPSEVEMRWQVFTGLTIGYTMFNAFTVGGGNTTLFSAGNESVPVQPYYNNYKETLRQAKNLQTGMTRLISYGASSSIVRGKDSSGVTKPLPASWKDFAQTDAPVNQQYMTSITNVTNLGTKNGGFPGDVYVGFFNPLLTSYGNPAGEAYFMVTNALGGDDANASGLVTEYQQSMQLNFNFGASGINSLLRLRRSDSTVETVPLTLVSGSTYKLNFTLDGGTGDLFKYNDGYGFVGFPSGPADRYWDNDANAANNVIGTGAGMGGTGTWDTTSLKWYTGSSDVAWTQNNNAIFWGSAGTVTLGAAQTVNTLTFKTTGYTITGSTLTLTTSSVTVDSGVTATISSIVAGTVGLVKNGAGTLFLTNSANQTSGYTGGTTINAGTLNISTGAMGLSGTGVTINNGAKLQFTGSFTLASARSVTLGSGGGVIDSNGSTVTIAGVISGSTALTKAGAGTLALTNTETYSGGTTVTGGTLQIGGGGTLGSITGNVTDNATLAFNRSDNLTYAGIVSGSGVFNKLGTGTLTLTNVSTYTGGTNVSAGNLTIGTGGGLNGLGPVTLPAGATLTRSAGSFVFTTMTHNGGTFSHTVANHLLVAASSGANYNLTSGSLTTHSSYGLWIGATGTYASGNGTLTQSGGTITSNRFELGHTAGWTGTYNLSGTGQANYVDGFVGGTNAAGAGTGVLNISGGTMTLTGWLHVWNTGAAPPGGTRVNLSAGTLSVFGLNTHGNDLRWNWTGGTFNLGAGGWIHVAQPGGVAGPLPSLLTIGDDGPMGASLDLSKNKNLVLNHSRLTVAPEGSLKVSGGSLTTEALANDGAFTQTSGTSAVGDVTGSGSMSVSGASVFANRIEQQSLSISRTGSVNLAAVGTASEIGSLSITGAGKLDLSDNSLLVHNATREGIESLVRRGQTNGQGIFSSAATDAARLGVLDEGAIGILVKYTYTGDADLNGIVDTTDFNDFLIGYNGAASADWSHGDFNYDGKVTSADYDAFMTGYAAYTDGQSLTSFAVPEATPAPEPASAVTACGFALILLRRRRKT